MFLISSCHYLIGVYIMKVLVCEDSVIGIYSAIYEAWAGKYNRNELEIKIQRKFNLEFFKEYITVAASGDNAAKVINTVRKQFGAKFMYNVTMAMWSYEEDRADNVYKTIKYGIENKIKGNFLSYLQLPYIQRINDLYANVYYEIDHFYGFLRFSELDKGALFARIRPKNYCLEALAEHFEDRLPSENWIINDVSRNIAAVHVKYKKWFLIKDFTGDGSKDSYRDNYEDNDLDLKFSDEEEKFRSLWKHFFDSVAIEERNNKKLQKNNLPDRFREFMTEFK